MVSLQITNTIPKAYNQVLHECQFFQIRILIYGFSCESIILNNKSTQSKRKNSYCKNDKELTHIPNNFDYHSYLVSCCFNYSKIIQKSEPY